MDVTKLATAVGGPVTPTVPKVIGVAMEVIVNVASSDAVELTVTPELGVSNGEIVPYTDIAEVDRLSVLGGGIVEEAYGPEGPAILDDCVDGGLVDTNVGTVEEPELGTDDPL